MKKKKQEKILKTSSKEKHEDLRDGIKCRAETWSKFKTEKRSDVKRDLRKDYL